MRPERDERTGRPLVNGRDSIPELSDDELDELPDGCRRGENANAFLGGFRLWDPDWLSHLTA